MPKSKIRCQTTEIRENYYQTSDGLVGLGWARRREPATKGDAELARLQKNLEKAFDAFRTYLNANYLWD